MQFFQFPFRLDEVYWGRWKLVYNYNNCSVPEKINLLQETDKYHLKVIIPDTVIHHLKSLLGHVQVWSHMIDSMGNIKMRNLWWLGNVWTENFISSNHLMVRSQSGCSDILNFRILDTPTKRKTLQEMKVMCVDQKHLPLHMKLDYHINSPKSPLYITHSKGWPSVQFWSTYASVGKGLVENWESFLRVPPFIQQYCVKKLANLGNIVSR